MKQKDINYNIIYSLVLIGIAIVGLFITVICYRGEINDLEERINKLEGNREIFNFNVNCDGNDVIANANYSMNDYELYKKLIKIYDIPNCKITYDALHVGEEK